MPNHRCVRALTFDVGGSDGGRDVEGEKTTTPHHCQKHPETATTTTAHISVASPSSSGGGGGGAASATTAALTKRLAMILLSCLVVAPAARAQGVWTPAVCGGSSCTDSSLEGWQKDVRALQALHRDCGGGQTWQSWSRDPGPWEQIPTFSGSRNDWDDVCENHDNGVELDCDGDGRIILIHMTQKLDLMCRERLPTEFSYLSELAHLQMDGQLQPWWGIDVAHVFQPLLGLTNLKVISFANNGLTGVIPALCTYSSFTASATKLEKLRLGMNKLSGQPPSSLDCMTRLVELDLSHNQLTGQLPDTWASLLRLETLRLSSNRWLGGTIPSAWFVSGGGMNILGTLEAEFCGLTGTIPTNFGAMNNLKTVKLSTNSLTGEISASMANLADLVVLDISVNQLSGSLPANLFTALNSLEDLDLSKNRLNGTIPQMTIDRLRNLDLSENYLEGSIPLLASATGLTILSLAKNRLTGTIPDMSTLIGLETLQLQQNALEGALPDLSGSSYLISVDISLNKLSSGLTTWLGTNKPNLKDVKLERNNLTGELPSPLCFSRLRILDLRGNNVWGTIPESISSCTDLRTLYLGTATHILGSQQSSSGGVSSTLPSSSAFAQLTKVKQISFAGLGLQGTVPTSLFSLEDLEYLDLSHNNFTGSIPNVAAGRLKDLILDGNKLTGEVPESLLTLPDLRHLYLNDNLITGVQTPNASSFDIELTDLHLAGNNLVEFPPVLRNMSSLATLDLSRNRLAGAPPAWLGQLERLKDLRLSQNNLRGPLTGWLNADNKLTALTMLLLDGNDGVTGPLTAAAIRPLAKLQTLNLNGVGSFGIFPEALGTPEASLGALKEFNASDAGLTGQLPPRFFEALKSLERLDLRRNSLTGTIPSDADSASSGDGDGGNSRRMLLNASSSSSPVLTHANLVSLLLSNNQLSGLVPALPQGITARVTADDVDNTNADTIDLTNAAGSSGFDCPLPDDHPAYATADCTCGAGRAGPDLNGLGPGRFQCDACVPGTVAAAQGTTACAPCSLGHFISDLGGTTCRACAPGAMAWAARIRTPLLFEPP